MNCCDVRMILNLYLDGEEHLKYLEACTHLESCKECRTWYTETEAALRILETVPDEIVSPDFALSVMARLPEQHPASIHTMISPKRMLLGVGLAWGFGALVLVGLIYGLVYSIHWNQLTSIIRFVESVFSVKGFISAIVALAEVMEFIGQVFRTVGESLTPLMIQFAILDFLVLCAVTLLWRWRIQLGKTIRLI